MAKVDSVLVRVVREHEGITQREAIRTVTTRMKTSTKTVRNYIRKLDGVRIRVVPGKPENRLFTIEYWERLEQRTYEERRIHTAPLKEVLHTFRGQVPTVDAFGSEPARDGVSPIVISQPRLEYDPREPLPVEGHPLFADLMEHLALLANGGRDASHLWEDYKGRIGTLKEAAEDIRKACVKWVEEESGVPKSVWAGKPEIPHHLVELLHEQAVAFAAGDDDRLKILRDTPPARTEESGGWVGLWIGGYGIIRLRAYPNTPAAR